MILPLLHCHCNVANMSWVVSDGNPEQLHAYCMAYTTLSATGCGAEAAIGQLTRLTSLYMSIDRMQSPPYQEMPPEERRHALRRLARQRSMLTAVPLQLQQLGCSAAARAAGGDGSIPRCHSSEGSGPAARRNTGLQELELRCQGWLPDDELSAAAGAMPGLRRLRVVGGDHSWNQLRGLSGAGLAAFSTCRRLQDILLTGSDLEGQQLVVQLPQLSSLTSVVLRECPGVNSSTVTQLQAAFQAEHGCHLQVAVFGPGM